MRRSIANTKDLCPYDFDHQLNGIDTLATQGCVRRLCGPVLEIGLNATLQKCARRVCPFGFDMYIC